MSHLRRESGISVLEALVALAVVAFGMLGVVGMQGTLRSNSDIAKQRAEAVRVAQAAIEDWRSFGVLDTTPGAIAWADIASIVGGSVSQYSSANTNTTYTLNANVQAPALGAPKVKTFEFSVSWPDRTGVTQSVTMVSSAARIAPDLAGSMALPADRGPMQKPGGGMGAVVGLTEFNTALGKLTLSPLRNASDVAVGTTYVIDADGSISQICSTAPVTPLTTPPTGCTAVQGLWVAGFIRFVTGTSSNPTGLQAENPTNPAFIPSPLPAFDVAVSPLTLPSSPSFAPACHKPTRWQDATYIGYFCVVPITTTAPFQWTGKVVLSLPSPTAPATTPVISATLADTDPANYKVCRYTSMLTNSTVAPSHNIDHPFVYTSVTTPLWNQNFLVISAGNGTTAFTCPGDDTSTPLVDGSTYPHQPDS